jgi:hypothetical protein
MKPNNSKLNQKAERNIKQRLQNLRRSAKAAKKTKKAGGNAIRPEWKSITGANSNILGGKLFRQVLAVIGNGPTHKDEDIFATTMAALKGIGPKDELEGMLAAQMVAVHTTAMEMSARALADGQTVDGVDRNINRVTKLMRTFTTQLEALNKYRTKGQQKITVQHVNVNDGGQAIVGDVNQGGGNG